MYFCVLIVLLRNEVLIENISKSCNLIFFHIIYKKHFANFEVNQINHDYHIDYHIRSILQTLKSIKLVMIITLIIMIIIMFAQMNYRYCVKQEPTYDQCCIEVKKTKWSLN